MDLRRLERDISRGSVDAAFRVAAAEGRVPTGLAEKALLVLRRDYSRMVQRLAAGIGPNGRLQELREVAAAVARSQFVTLVPWLAMSDLGTIDPGDARHGRTEMRRKAALDVLLHNVREELADIMEDRRSWNAAWNVLRDVMDAAADARFGAGWVGSHIDAARRPPNTAFVYSYANRNGWTQRHERAFAGRISGWELATLREADERFIPEQVDLTPLQGGLQGAMLADFDHPWHEFQRVGLVDDEPDDVRDIHDFVREFVAKEWDGEAAMDRILRASRTRSAPTSDDEDDE